MAVTSIPSTRYVKGETRYLQPARRRGSGEQKSVLCANTIFRENPYMKILEETLTEIS